MRCPCMYVAILAKMGEVPIVEAPEAARLKDDLRCVECEEEVRMQAAEAPGEAS